MARNTYIDALKGYAIFMVVLGHSLQRATTLGLIAPLTFAGAYAPFQGWVTMPLFFVISGFLCSGRVRTPRWKWISDKAGMLLVPWAAWTAAYYFLIRDPLWPNHMPFGQYMLTQLTAPSLWYFLTLFEIYVIVALCTALGEWGPLVLAVILLAFIKTPYALSIEYYCWFVAGWYGARAATRLVAWRKYFWALGVPIYVLLLPMNLAEGSLRYLPVMAMGSMALATLVVWLLRKTPAMAPLKVMGARSFEIYAAQFLFTQIALVHSMWNVALTTTLAIVGPLLIGELLRRTPVTNALFLGSRGATPLPEPATA